MKFGSAPALARPPASARLCRTIRKTSTNPHLQEHKTLHPSDPTQLPRAKHTGMLSGYLITDGLAAHYESYRFAESLLPPANIPVLMPRDAEDQKLPESFTAADRLRLGIRQHKASDAQPGSRRSGDSLRLFVG